MGFKLFGLTFSYGYQAYIQRLNENLQNALSVESEVTFENIKAQSIGVLFTAFTQLPKIFHALDQPIPQIVIYSCSYFFSGLFKKMFEKITCEEVQMIDKQTIGLIRGKCMVCKLDFINQSFTMQSEYSNPVDMLRRGISIMLSSIESKPTAECTLYMLTCLKEIIERIKEKMLIEDFMEFDIISKIVSSLMELLNTSLSRPDHKQFRMVILEIIGSCYFEDEKDNYLTSIMELAAKLFSDDQRSKDSQQDTVLKIFCDVSGMMKAVGDTRVAIAVIRVW